MQPTSIEQNSPPIASDQPSQSVRLERTIEKIGNWLPVSGPITAFAWLNTLQGFEDLPFDEAVKRAGRLFGCHPYLTENRYREKFVQGRIRRNDLAAVLAKDLGDGASVSINSLATRLELRLAMLEYPLRSGPPAELRWFVAETDALTRLRADAPSGMRERFIAETRHWIMRDLRVGGELVGREHAVPRDPRIQHLLADLVRHFGESTIELWSDEVWETLALQALWRICREGASSTESVVPPPAAAVRHRDILLEATAEDSDQLVHEVLIRFCAAFTDQGFAHWALPHRDAGLYRCFGEIYGQPAGPPQRWLAGLPAELERLDRERIGPLESILESLEMLGVGEDEWDDYLAATMLALRGWASMIFQNEVRADRVPVPVPPGSLVEFLAVRLILDRLAIAHIARQTLGYTGPLAELRAVARAKVSKHAATSEEQRAFWVFQLAQVLGWYPPALYHMSKRQWSTLMAEIETFGGLERRRLFHLAFERRFRTQTLDALSVYTRRPPERVKSPRFQAVFCIDTREESFRRHLEELIPEAETFSTAGFFGVAIYYRGVADAHFAALCPIVIKPKHWVTEEVVYPLEESNRARAKTRRAIGTASHQFHVRSRAIAAGAFLSASLGVLASVPLVARVMFPLGTARIRRTAGRLVQPPPITRLRLERVAAEPSMDEEGIGFSLDEMYDLGERMLREIGLTSGFSRLVLLLGHGSYCLNNPHKSAYDCGACSGNAGSPNARAMAAMLNDRRVRDVLAKRGLTIPSDTWFLGGLHNTCADSLAFFDLDLLPMSHLRDFERARDNLERVCQRNAHERCRRFESAPLDMTLAEAQRHVEGRAEDLAQTRPEFGNASNAICVVGRRARTRGLYLDRRAFLMSYDPIQDDAESSILARILGAVVPVCEGINLTYFFSYIDSTGWGCGTKLPHNVTSLLGVMDGASSDLRLGLPWQGVEIHEPVRLLFVIETTEKAIRGIMERNELVRRIICNGWVQLSLLDPHSSRIQVFRQNQFHPYQPVTTELPKVPSSVDWYRGWREHLEFAVIESG
ncbi:MAG TPA: DUF2309 domain-containing protein [Pirellulales bacterium]|nr:DUF2309 domain-containing protein [Pirellulales bacterium]